MSSTTALRSQMMMMMMMIFQVYAVKYDYDSSAGGV
jgi:hypothetical protein